MSLVGSLEDLGLGDILQIISLSRKSGLLLLRSDRGEGRITFQDGQVRGALVKGGPADLRALVVSAGVLSDAEFDAVEADARARSVSVPAALVAHPALSVERLDELRRASAEAAVVEMFRWRAGDFSFEIRDESDADRDAGLLLTDGLSAQYLAMEATRLRDEAGPAASGIDAHEAAPDPGGFVFSGEEPAPESSPEPSIQATRKEVDLKAAAVELIATAAVEEASSDEGEEVATVEARPDGEGPDAEAVAAPVLAQGERALQSDTAGAARGPSQRGPAPPVIVIDRDLATLEWVKSALRGSFARVHIFQVSEHAIGRLRQYLVKGDAPVMVVSDRAPPDPLSGARGAREIIERIKAQSPKTPVLLLLEAEVGGGPKAVARTGGADAITLRPSAAQLANPRLAQAVAEAARRLEHTIGLWAVRATGSVEARGPRSGEVQRLRKASERLRHPSSRGEVLPLVMRFAAESFSRVAMFMLRDDLAVGIAQIGLSAAGGPDDAALQRLRIPAAESAWLRAVCERRTPVRGAPSDAGDRRLALLLGDAPPVEAYVAPIESGERVVAVLYADNLPSGAPIGDTSALEVVLHEAGLALDRAVLERALAEAEIQDSTLDA
ncbi:MAG TPA: hypothetical protein DEP35_06800 [Deltaproteobacteria bacterium]|nr:hypothetical protein [Deltaproteobacteria bacterium]